MIKDARRVQGVALRDLGAKVGVCHVFISWVEKGRAIPSLPVVLRLATALGIDPAQAQCAAERSIVERWRNTLENARGRKR